MQRAECTGRRWESDNRPTTAMDRSGSLANLFPKSPSGVGFFFRFPNGRAAIRNGHAVRRGG